MTTDSSSSGIEQYLDWLNPTQRKDYRAVEIEGKTQAERAEERDVAPATISSNVNNAKERLRDIAEERSGNTEIDQ